MGLHRSRLTRVLVKNGKAIGWIEESSQSEKKGTKTVTTGLKVSEEPNEETVQVAPEIIDGLKNGKLKLKDVKV